MVRFRLRHRQDTGGLPKGLVPNTTAKAFRVEHLPAITRIFQFRHI